VKNNAEVIEAVGSDPLVSLIASNSAHAMLEVSVAGTTQLYAIVYFDRASRPPTMAPACLTPLPIGDRDPRQHPCEQ
jgi:hypothetical protein